MGWTRLAERLGAALALTGAALSLFIAGLVTMSVALRWATSSGLPGDFEMVQMAVALAIFSFLPYTQLRRGNMLVDTFTSRLPNARLLGDDLHQAPDGVSSAIQGVSFDPLREREEEDDHGGLGVLPNRERPENRNRHEEVDVQGERPEGKQPLSERGEPP